MKRTKRLFALLLTFTVTLNMFNTVLAADINILSDSMDESAEPVLSDSGESPIETIGVDSGEAAFDSGEESEQDPENAVIDENETSAGIVPEEDVLDINVDSVQGLEYGQTNETESVIRDSAIDILAISVDDESSEELFSAVPDEDITVINEDTDAGISVMSVTETTPIITTQPTDVSCELNETATFSIAVEGTGLTYQWQYSDNEGKTWTTSAWKNTTYSVTATEARNNRLARCIVTDAEGNTVTSGSARLTVKQVLSIVMQPADVTCKVNETATFSIAAEGTGLTYQWQYSDNEGVTWLTSAWKNTTYSVTATEARNNRLVRCTVADAAGNMVISGTARLIVKQVLSIVTQPADVTCKVNETATFTIEVDGDGLTYQWQYSDNEGVTWLTSAWKNTTYSVTATEARNNRLVRCTVTDAAGNTVTSESACLTVKPVLGIVMQPADVTCKVNETATFTIEADGNGLTYQWQYSDNEGVTWLTSAWKNTTYSVTATEARNNRLVRCTVTDAAGNTVMSEAACLTVKPVLSIVTQPADVTCKVSETATFTIEADGDGLTYQWQYSDNEGKTWATSAWKNTAYSVTAAVSRNNRLVRCIVTDAAGNTVTSEAARLTVKPVLSIVTQPADVTCKVSETATFTIEADGDGLTYQWQYSDNEGVTWLTSAWKNTTYSVTATEARNNRLVRCTVTDAAGNTVMSEAARLTVKPVLGIVMQPADVTCKVSETATFTIEADGNGLTYQWQYSDNEGVTWLTSAWKNTTYSVTATEARNNRLVRCTVTDASGNTVTSETARLTVKTVLNIVTQPVDVICELNETATFTIEADGDGLTYQWQYSDNEGVTWATSAYKNTTYFMTATEARNKRLVRCIVTDTAGNSVISNAVRLVLRGIGPKISVQPSDALGTLNGTVEFSVVTVESNLTYQWEYSSDCGVTWNILDSDSSSCMVTVLEENIGDYYRCIVYDAYGNQTISEIAALIQMSDMITKQPEDWTGCEGGTVYFSVEAEGESLTYQWQYSSDDGATWKNSSVQADSYSAAALASYNGRLYRCIVTNQDGEQAVSKSAALTISSDFAIVSQPKNLEGELDASLIFEIQAGGTNLTYQWQMSSNGVDDWQNVTTTSTATKARMSQKLAPSTIGKYYRCIVTNDNGDSLTSNVVRMTWASTGFFTYGDYTYYVNEAGIVVTGLQNIEGKVYSFRSNGTMQTGTQMINDTLYHFDSETGAATIGFYYEESNHATYYFGDDGAACKGFQEIDGQQYYFYDTGVLAHGITQIGADQYYFDFDTGARQSGLVKVGLTNYMYCDENGISRTGLINVNGKLYYFSEETNALGISESGLQTVNGTTYYFDPETKQAVTGLVEYNGYTYYMGDDCTMQTGLQMVDGKLYYFAADGTMQSGFRSINGSRYYFDEDTGAAISGWYTSGANVTYYFSTGDFAAVTGLQIIDENTYYFSETGYLQTGLVKTDTVSYYFSDSADDNGTGFQSINGKTYYVNGDHTIATGLQTIDGKLYLFSDSGIMQTGMQTVDAVRYYFNLTTGEAETGFITRENAMTYYFDGANGTLSGLQMIDGSLYYLSQLGIVQYGRFKIDDQYYFFDTVTGQAVSGWRTITGSSGTIYQSYFDPETYQAMTGLQTIDGKLYYFDTYGYMLTGRRTVDEISYYFDSVTGEAYTGWYQSAGGYYYYYDGVNGMLQGPAVYEIDGAYYYFGLDNNRETGIKTLDGIKMYFDPTSAALVTGYVFVEDDSYANGGKIYYFDGLNGVLTGFQTIDGNVYAFSDDGILQVSGQKIGDTRYHFDSLSGIRVSGLLKSASSNHYYMIDETSSTGIKTGVIEYGNVLYNVSTSTGIPLTGHLSASSNPLGFRAYFDADTGEQQLGLINYTSTSGVTYPYYFQKDGCITSGITAIQTQLDAVKTNGGWGEVEGVVYYAENGEFLTGLQAVDGNIYYFSTMTGARMVGLHRIGDDYYYFDLDSGVMKTGWQEVEGKQWYFDPATGRMLTGLQEIDGKLYLLLEGGGYGMLTVQIGSDSYTFTEEAGGILNPAKEAVDAPVPAENAYSWKVIDGDVYYCNGNGDFVTGVHIIDNVIYYFGQNGARTDGFVTINGNTYYYNEGGKMTGLQVIGDKTYYFSPTDGAMQTGLCDVSGTKYFFGADGVMQTGWVTLDMGIGYLTESDGLLTGLQTIDGKIYRFNASGIMSTGVVTIDLGNDEQMICMFGANGVMVHGLVQTESGLFYYSEETGARETGWITLDGSEYYFSPTSGKALTGLQNIDGRYYYFDTITGQRKLGLQTIAGRIYYLNDDESGDGLTYGLVEINDQMYYFSESSGAAWTGYHTIDGIRYYFDPETGASVGGIYWVISGYAYAFIAGGGYQTGMVEENGKKYYFYPSTGRMATGLLSEGNVLYYFDPVEGMLYDTEIEIAGIRYKIDEYGSVTAVDDSTIAQLINAGIAKLGLPYGSEDSDTEEPGSYSCSRFTSKVYSEIGIEFRDTAYLQYYSLLHGGYDVEVIKDYSQAQPGDLIYTCQVDCKYGEDCTFWNEIHHVSIYLGDGKVMEATQGARSGVLVQDWEEIAASFNFAIIRINGVFDGEN